VCHAIAGNAIASCQLLAWAAQPPNPRVEPTPQAASEIVAILTRRFG